MDWSSPEVQRYWSDRKSDSDRCRLTPNTANKDSKDRNDKWTTRYVEDRDSRVAKKDDDDDDVKSVWPTFEDAQRDYENMQKSRSADSRWNSNDWSGQAWSGRDTYKWSRSKQGWYG